MKTPRPGAPATLLLAPLLALLVSLCAPASAQTIYKCTLDGKISYNETPCANGASLALSAPAAPAPAAATEDRTRLARQQTAAERLARERLRAEAKDERDRERGNQRAAAHQKKCGALILHHKWAVEDARTAPDKGAAAAKTKARRAAERLALECPA